MRAQLSSHLIPQNVLGTGSGVRSLRSARVGWPVKAKHLCIVHALIQLLQLHFLGVGLQEVGHSSFNGGILNVCLNLAAKADGCAHCRQHACPSVHVGEYTSQFVPSECLCAATHHRGTLGSGQYEVGVVLS